MAKINNQEVIQKLIDELRLYPSTDAIPTELAEKILPVFQINDTAINFKESGTKRYLVNASAGNVTQVTTVPTGKKWRLDMFSWIFACDATAVNRIVRCQILDDNSNIVMEGGNLKGSSTDPQTASETRTYTLSNQSNASGSSGTAGVASSVHSLDANDSIITKNYPLPLFSEKNLVLLEGWTINIIVTNGVAGDTITSMVQVNQEDNDYQN